MLDSGLPGREIVWQGDPGAQVSISGGIPIVCKKAVAPLWDCPIKTPPVNTTFFDSNRINGNTPKFELYVNDQKLDLARWPDKGWAHIKLPQDYKKQFSVIETLPNISGDVTAAQIHTFAGNDWYDQYIGIESINQTGNSIKLSAPTGYNLRSGRRFYIQNLPSLLNAPSEWIVDAANKISFIPPIGITPKVAILSSLKNILITDGISNLTFKNISFQHSTGTAIVVKNSTNVTLNQLDVNNIGGKGVEIKSGHNVQLINSKIHHVGAEGIDIAGGDRTTLQGSDHLIHNNHIHHISTVILTATPAIRLAGVGIKTTHNLLEQGGGTAIILTGNDHLIEKNEVHDFCLQSADCGAIYSGRDWSYRGNTIKNNYIHDIIGYGMNSVDVAKNQVVYKSPNFAVGVYLDDGASGFNVSGNIFENAGLRVIQLSGGRDNKITNNYFNTNETAILIDNRWPTFNWNKFQANLDTTPYKTTIWQEKYPELAAPMHNRKWPEGNRIEKNIIVTSRAKNNLVLYQIPVDSTVIADNLFWSTTGTGDFTISYLLLELNKKMNGGKWTEWIAEGVEQGSIVADPCVTISNKKMTTCAGSPVNNIGFVPLATDIGLLP
ncbi:MAG: right-handed parallel beta-helix repeat-containing protein [Methylococcales bacterium]|nr:right-handed parallel beta-helix repeat-containing protein [Methylococcales bacterium]